MDLIYQYNMGCHSWLKQNFHLVYARMIIEIAVIEELKWIHGCLEKSDHIVLFEKFSFSDWFLWTVIFIDVSFC